MSRQYRTERKLPARFIKEDRDHLWNLVAGVYRRVGYDAVGMDYEDFALDTVFHQILPVHGGVQYASGRRWESENLPLPLAESLVWRDAMREGRKDDAKRIWSDALRTERHPRRHPEICEDTLLAYVGWADPDHEWACSVACMAMKQYADRRGRLQG